MTNFDLDLLNCPAQTKVNFQKFFDPNYVDTPVLTLLSFIPDRFRDCKEALLSFKFY